MGGKGLGVWERVRWIKVGRSGRGATEGGRRRNWRGVGMGCRTHLGKKAGEGRGRKGRDEGGRDGAMPAERGLQGRDEEGDAGVRGDGGFGRRRGHTGQASGRGMFMRGGGNGG